MSVSRDWLDDHGYVHIRCPRCGWSGYTDSGVCEGCDDGGGETCESCGDTHADCRCSEGFAHEGITAPGRTLLAATTAPASTSGRGTPTR